MYVVEGVEEIEAHGGERDVDVEQGPYLCVGRHIRRLVEGPFPHVRLENDVLYVGPEDADLPDVLEDGDVGGEGAEFAQVHLLPANGVQEGFRDVENVPDALEGILELPFVLPAQLFLYDRLKNDNR